MGVPKQARLLGIGDWELGLAEELVSKEPTLAVYAEFITSEGNFTIRLFDQEAPNTVANFVGLAEGIKEWTDPRTNQKV